MGAKSTAFFIFLLDSNEKVVIKLFPFLIHWVPFDYIGFLVNFSLALSETATPMWMELAITDEFWKM